MATEPSRPPTPIPDDALSKLPELCKVEIIGYLPGRDVANLRLTSRTWGGICVEGLFNIPSDENVREIQSASVTSGVLSIRPVVGDMDRIREISERPWMARHIKQVVIYAGDVDLEKFFAFTRKTVHSEPEVIFDPKLFPKIMHRHVNVDDLSDALSRFPHVEHFSILSKEYPFQKNRFLEDAWRQATWQPWERFKADPIATLLVYSDILLAIANLQTPVKSLLFDWMPSDIFAWNTLNITSDLQAMTTGPMPSSFSGIENLDLGLALSYEPELDNLDKFISNMLHLRNLSISIRSNDYSDHGSRRIWQTELLYKHSWPKLQSLRLSGFKTANDLLTEFVLKHSSSLKNMSLVGCSDDDLEPVSLSSAWSDAEEVGNVRQMLTKFRENLHLDKFQFSLQVDTEEVYDENWNWKQHYAAAHEWKVKHKLPPSDMKLLENFVLGKCSWPMSTDVPGDGASWNRLSEWTAAEMVENWIDERKNLFHEYKELGFDVNDGTWAP